MDNGMNIGTHILAELITENNLTACDSYIDFVRSVLVQNDIHYLDEVHYIFDNNSFTASIILAESHINVHTWPERNLANLDIFVCNFNADNEQKTINIYDAIEEYFKPSEKSYKLIKR